jgi:hypothetical protein
LEESGSIVVRGGEQARGEDRRLLGRFIVLGGSGWKSRLGSEWLGFDGRRVGGWHGGEEIIIETLKELVHE